MLNRLSFRSRLLWGGVLLQILTLALIALGASSLVDRHLDTELENRVSQLKPLLNSALGTPMAQRDYASVTAILAESRAARGLAFIEVCDAAGRLIAHDGEPRPAQADAADARHDARDSSPPALSALLYPSHAGAREFEVPLTLGGQALGSVKFGLSRNGIEQTRRSILLAIGLVGLALLVLFSALLAVLSHSLTRPLRDLVIASRDIHAGNYDVSLDTRRGDEIGVLMRSFDRMNREIKRKVSELTHSEYLQRTFHQESLLRQAETARALDEAERANQSKSEFLASMSHEIRTPMNAVLGLTELVLSTSLHEDQRENLMLVKSSADSLLGIINDLLDFSKIEAGHLDLEPVAFDLPSTLEALVWPHRPQAADKGIRLDLSIDPSLPRRIRAPSLRMGQVLSNLVGNAIKFTMRGSVRVQVSGEWAGPEALVLHVDVIDTGIGIPADKLALIFEPFSQADNSITRRFGGTGLGLTISRRLALAMGGNLTVRSVPGEGSCFSFEMPASQALPEESTLLAAGTAQSRPAQTAGTSNSAGATATGHLTVRSEGSLAILVVDDNPINLKLAVALVTQAGHAASVATNGLEAIAACQARAVDVILMDVQMPDMDGLEATRRIRALERDRTERVAIIAITANAMAGDRDRCMAAGMDDYLSKPFRRAELLAAIARATQGAAFSAASALTGESAYAAGLVRADAEIIAIIGETFLQQCPVLMDQADAEWERSDLEALARSAHTLKGLFLTFNAQVPARMAREIEQSAQAARLASAQAPVDIPASLAVLRQEGEAFCKALARHLAHQGATLQA